MFFKAYKTTTFNFQKNIKYKYKNIKYSKYSDIFIFSIFFI